jgi:hypothetical protein
MHENQNTHFKSQPGVSQPFLHGGIAGDALSLTKRLERCPLLLSAAGFNDP